MSSSRSRFVAILAAVPLVLTAGPLAAPALAVDAVRPATMVTTLGKLRVGPNAGFRGDTARGVNGSTAVVAFDASASDTVSSAQIVLRQDEEFSVFNEFNDIDGFALYKDLDDNDKLDTADYAAGPVSQPRYGVGSTGDGGLLITVTGDPEKATGEDSYLLAVHPSTDVQVERTLHFTVPAEGIDLSGGTDVPATAVALPNIVLDSLAPAAIPAENFTPVNRIPTATCPTPAPDEGCGDDAYKIHRAGVALEDNEMIGFFNATDVIDTSAMLTKTVNNAPSPVEFSVASLSADADHPNEISIGNGTGRDATVAGSRALNNQLSDDVVVRQWDQMGNLTELVLTNKDGCTTTCPTPGFVARGNDVTAPKVTYTVEMDAVTASSTLTAIPVRAKVTGPDPETPTGQNSDVAHLARVERVAATTAEPPTYEVKYPGVEVRSNYLPLTSSQQTITTSHNLDNSNYPENWLVRGAGVLIDRTGNATAPATSTPVWKDTVAPTISKISPIDADHSGTIGAGDEVRVEFSEPMDPTKITSANVETALSFTQPASCGGPTSTADCISWGEDAVATWSEGDLILTVQFGTVCGTWHPVDCPETNRLPAQGDVVNAASSVVDKRNNPIPSASRAKAIAAPLVIFLSAETKDESIAPTQVNAFNTNRDGVLDAIDLLFSGDVTTESVTAASNAHLFHVTTGGDPLPATASRTAANTVRLTFDIPVAERPDWRTGALPVVSLADHATIHLMSGDQVVEPFSRAAVDKAPPVPLRLSTQEATVDGHIDHVLVQYTEPVVHGDENNPCGYSVSAPYANASYQPPHATTAPNLSKTCPGSRNEAKPVPTGATSSDTVSLTLVTQSAYDTEVTPSVTFSQSNQVPAYALKPASAEPDAPKCNTATDQSKLTSATTPTCPISDTSGNGLATFSGVAEDGAAPAIIERFTADANADGYLDEVHIKFSEIYSSASLQATQFTLTNPSYPINALSLVGDREAMLEIQRSTDPKGDTGATPTLTSLGGFRDVASPPNTAGGDTGTAVTDKAGPAIVGACTSSPAANAGICPVESATDDKIAVLFSEAVSNVAASDFVVEQDGATKTQSATAPSVGGTGDYANRVVTLSFAEGTIDATKDALVRLAGGAEFVTDSASNHSTQTSNVPVYGMPTVTINLTCPVPANPNFCVQLLVNTGVTGSAGVRLWRLSDTARATTPPDSEFSTTVPATKTLIEGPNTQYLTGKDQFGRLSEEKSDSITIYLPPKIEDLVYQNLTTPDPGTYTRTGTVVDGDSLNVKATAYGADAAQWVSGGNCLAKYLSIDRRELTGVSTDGKVAPLSCDKPATGLPRRNLVFPVKAAGTTRYPVGTVLQTTPNDPGSMIVDASGGKQARRQFISVAARRSWQITDGSVILVPSQAVSAIPRTTNLGYRDGALLRSTSSGAYYYMERGVKRPISTQTLAYWKIPTSQAYPATLTELQSTPSGSTLISNAASRHPIGTWVKFSNGSIQQIVRLQNGTVVRRQLAASAALKTLVPSAQVVPANSYDAKLAKDSFLRGYRDGTLLKLSSGSYAVVARGSLRRFKDGLVFNTLGYNKNTALTANGLAVPRFSGQTYRTGAVITRHLITTIVVTVTNTAGATKTAKVLPQYGGIYGVGTYDPVPAGWDFSRS